MKPQKVGLHGFIAEILFISLPFGLLSLAPRIHGANTFADTGSLNTARGGSTATLLPNGKVLEAGGKGNGNAYLDSTELYDPAISMWTTSGNFGATRAVHTATLLPNGKVLAAGGYNDVGGYLASAELYDPATGMWTTTGNFATARAVHTATYFVETI